MKNLNFKVKSLVNIQHSLQIIKFLVFVFFFSSCTHFSDIKIGDVKNVEVRGFEDNSFVIAVKLDVDNPTMHNLKITDINTKVFINNQYIGKILSDEPIVFSKKTSAEYSIVLKVRLSNILGTAFTMMQLSAGNKVNVRLEGELTVHSFILKKKIPVNETRQITI